MYFSFLGFIRDIDSPAVSLKDTSLWDIHPLQQEVAAIYSFE
jgi:hypothetical protein